MAFVKPNKPPGALHNFSQKDLFCSSSSHGNLSQHSTVMPLSPQMATPGTSGVSAAEPPSSWWRSTAQWVTLEANNSASKSNELWTASLDESERCQIARDVNVWRRPAEFLRIRGPARLMNASRVHVGPVNGSSNVMKQPLRAGKWSVRLNRNVTTQ